MMRTDPPNIWDGEYASQYESSNYGKGLSGWVLSKSHELVEKAFDKSDHFPRVLEVGAGSGFHLSCVRHKFDEYWLTDKSDRMLVDSMPEIDNKKIKIASEDASALSFLDDSFDRLIACHVLEHIYEPHLALKEWFRVVRPGGVLSIVLPCDPGLLWRIGRNFGPRSTAKKNGLDYDFVMAREHVNPINNLVAFIQYYFENKKELWWPARAPLSDINLIYAVNIYL